MHAEKVVECFSVVEFFLRVELSLIYFSSNLTINEKQQKFYKGWN